MGDEPALGRWLVRGIVFPETRELIGHVGFHGPPGHQLAEGARRGRGRLHDLPRAPAPGLRDRGRARRCSTGRAAQGIDHFVASVGPGNEPSLAIVRRLGFVEVGRHWDDEDGEELEFELQARRVRKPAPSRLRTSPTASVSSTLRST